MVAVLFADGFEEMEALAPVDIMRRAGIDVQMAGVTGMTVTGSHGIVLQMETSAQDIDAEKIDMLVLPGGGKGTENLDASPVVDKLVKSCYNNGKRLAAICAAPSVLGKRGLLKGREAICFPGFEKYLDGAVLSQKTVVTDGNITTGKSAGYAKEFGLELVRVLTTEANEEKIRNSLEGK